MNFESKIKGILIDFAQEYKEAIVAEAGDQAAINKAAEKLKNLHKAELGILNSDLKFRVDCLLDEGDNHALTKDTINKLIDVVL